MWMLETLFDVAPNCCVIFVLNLCFLTCFYFRNHQGEEETGCFTSIYVVAICVLCPFFKVQWVNQQSVIVTFPSHIHL